MKIKFDQVCALVIFLACIILIACKIDGEVKATMTLAVGYLIGTGYQSRKKDTGG
jgi:hypothetical protein